MFSYPEAFWDPVILVFMEALLHEHDCRMNMCVQIWLYKEDVI
jgi:hypothetical protein